jgi:long-chain fatty acid transport protein
MRRNVKWVLLAAGLIVLQAGLAQAAGFNIYEAGVRATALGGAFTATADDGSAMFYNAAGLSFQTGASVSLNMIGVNPRFKFQGATTLADGGDFAEAQNKTYPVPGAYYTNSSENSKLSFGVGVYAPFGLGVKWQDPETFVGRQVSYDVEIKTVYVTPAVSYMVADGLALAVGLDVAKQHINLHRMTLHPGLGVNALDTQIEGWSDLNFTPSFGVMFRPDEKLSLGAMYHHKKTMNYEDGDATLTNQIDPNDPGYSWSATLLNALGGSEHKINSELNLPYILSFGAAYQVTPRLRGEVNYVHFGWSTFASLALDSDTDALDQTLHFDYEDAWQIRFGLDYEAIPEKLNIMAGYVHDTTPQPLESVSPLLPDSDRNDYSLGVQVFNGNWEFNAAYMIVVGTERTNIENGEPANPDPAYPVGTYKSMANIFGAGVGYRF